MVKYTLEEINKKNKTIASRLNKTFSRQNPKISVDVDRRRQGANNDRRLQKNSNLTKKNDARFKIIQRNSNKKPTNNDARKQLLSKQKMANLKSRIQTMPSDSKQTCEQRLFKILKNQVPNDHLVHASRENTLVTIKNRLGVKAPVFAQDSSLFAKTIQNKTAHNYEDEEDDDDKELVMDTIGVLATKYKNIKIEITNKETENSAHGDIVVPSRLANRIGNIKPTKKTSNNQDDVDMDTDDVFGNNYKKPNDSPLQGYRLIISNLHETVSEDDIMELFSEIGPIKRAQLIKKGLADVVYVHLNDARNAIEQYNNRDLDGKPLNIELVTKIPISEKLRPVRTPSVANKSNEVAQQHQSPVVVMQPIKEKLSIKRLVKPPIVQLQQQPQAVKSTKSANTPNLVSSHFVTSSFATTQQQQQQQNSNVISTKFVINNQQPQQQQQQQASLKSKNFLLSLQQQESAMQTNTTQPKLQQPTAHNDSKIVVDTTVIHQALFNSSKSTSNNNNVTFTVKI